MKRLLIIGASGGIGYQAMQVALEQGHSVRALARHASTITTDHAMLEKVDADATDTDALRPALSGVDAVIFAIGAAKSLQRTFRPVHLFSASTAALLTEMRRTGVTRLVAVTGFGAGDSRQAQSLPERIIHRALLGHAYDDKDRQEAMIRDSGLDWLIVRPTILTNGRGQGRYRVILNPDEWRNGLIARRDVADFLVSEAVAPRYHHQTPVITN